MSTELLTDTQNVDMSIRGEDKAAKKREIKRVDAYILYLSLFSVCAVACFVIYFAKKLGWI